ncbi:hypothetical protein RPMD05_1 [Rhodobacteraceae phage LS06-2018-MD05]|nr:hypothetical protein RPMD05_1 [Rhodobacteraceae phage LS06-2018-MD05]
MRKLTRNISILTILIIVIFVNFNKENAIWDLFWFNQTYLIVFGFIILGWNISKDKLTRSLLLALGFYYSFEFIMDILNIFNPELYEILYKTKIINYLLALSCGCSLLILPLVGGLKKWIIAKVIPLLKKL